MYTYEDYQRYTYSDYSAGRCSYEDYYNQFVTAEIKARILRAFPIGQLSEAYYEDENLNTINLREWDTLARGIHVPLDNPSLAARVCIIKQAAKQLVWDYDFGVEVSDYLEGEAL